MLSRWWLTLYLVCDYFPDSSSEDQDLCWVHWQTDRNHSNGKMYNFFFSASVIALFVHPHTQICTNTLTSLWYYICGDLSLTWCVHFLTAQLSFNLQTFKLISSSFLVPENMSQPTNMEGSQFWDLTNRKSRLHIHKRTHTHTHSNQPFTLTDG